MHFRDPHMPPQSLPKRARRPQVGWTLGLVVLLALPAVGCKKSQPAVEAVEAEPAVKAPVVKRKAKPAEAVAAPAEATAAAAVRRPPAAIAPAEAPTPAAAPAAAAAAQPAPVQPGTPPRPTGPVAPPTPAAAAAVAPAAVPSADPEVAEVPAKPALAGVPSLRGLAGRPTPPVAVQPPGRVAPPVEAPVPARDTSGEPVLDVNGYIGVSDLEFVLGGKAKFRRSDLVGTPAGPGYNALYYVPQKGDQFGVSVQIWQDNSVTDARARFNTMRNTWSNVAPTNRITEQGFRAHFEGVVTLVFADPRRPIVAAVSCSAKICTGDQLAALAGRVAERLH